MVFILLLTNRCREIVLLMCLKKFAQRSIFPVAVAGGINSETVVEAVNAGAKIIVVGGAICKATDIKTATGNLKKSYIKRKKSSC